MTGTVEKVGEGDLGLRTEVTTADEIGTLGKEFNHMLDYIEALIAQVIRRGTLEKRCRAGSTAVSDHTAFYV